MSDKFPEFPKIARLSRECVITEKLDGTNALIYIDDNGEMKVGSRTRWITPSDDNYGFARWAEGNKDELLKLGPGHHYGEWWGSGIQRNYEMKEKQFSLFNTHRWAEARPACCSVVPVIYQGCFNTAAIDACIHNLDAMGSRAAPGFMKPEGIIIYHAASKTYFKKTLDKDDEWKGNAILRDNGVLV